MVKENYQERSKFNAGCFLKKMRNENQLSLIEKMLIISFSFFLRKKITTPPLLKQNYSTEKEIRLPVTILFNIFYLKVCGSKSKNWTR